MLKDKYLKEISPALKEKLQISNVMEIPKIEKVVLNVGYGRHVKDNAYIEMVEKTLTTISGQKPVHNKSKKSISNFKTREGMNIGVSVTLRGEKMYEFLYKYINLALPRVRDFRGLKRDCFDGKGNCAIGMKEHVAFPEVSADNLNKVHGLEVCITTTAKTDEQARSLLTKLGFPFKEANK